MVLVHWRVEARTQVKVGIEQGRGYKQMQCMSSVSVFD